MKIVMDGKGFPGLITGIDLHDYLHRPVQQATGPVPRRSAPWA